MENPGHDRVDINYKVSALVELRQVRYFLALSETLNFTRAAEFCNVTQPTLTLSIRKLEEEMGGSLVHRERGNTHLSQLGETLLPFLIQVFESSSAASRLAREIVRGDRVPLNFGISDVIKKSNLIDPLRKMSAVTKGLELHVVGGADAELAQQLEDGSLNLVLADETSVQSTRLRFYPIYSEGFDVLMLAEDELAQLNELTLHDLSKRPWITVLESKAHKTLAAELQNLAIGWMPKHRAMRSAEAQLLCLAGIGITLIGNREPILPGLVARPIRCLKLDRTVGLAEARGRQMSSAAMSFARTLRAIPYD